MSLHYPVEELLSQPKILRLLLLDHTQEDINTPNDTTTKSNLQENANQRNIIWATDDYSYRGRQFAFFCELTLDCIAFGSNSKLLSPRVYKSKDQQQQRTKRKAEVFTPSWICNAQNNLVDDAWFDRENVFNTTSEDGKNWKATEGKIKFPEGKTWQDYVKANRLEITCGEAPYLASRYDTTTGDIIPIEQRIGMLDRKLRVVSENTASLNEWYKWATWAFKATYGFEYQGDSLLIGRINMLNTFLDYAKIQEEKYGKTLPKNALEKIALIISWNLWQMDGLTYTVPGGVAKSETQAEQIFLFDEDEEFGAALEECAQAPVTKPSAIMDWGIGAPITFQSLLKRNN